MTSYDDEDAAAYLNTTTPFKRSAVADLIEVAKPFLFAIVALLFVIFLVMTAQLVRDLKNDDDGDFNDCITNVTYSNVMLREASYRSDDDRALSCSQSLHPAMKRMYYSSFKCRFDVDSKYPRYIDCQLAERKPGFCTINGIDHMVRKGGPYHPGYVPSPSPCQTCFCLEEEREAVVACTDNTVFCKLCDPGEKCVNDYSNGMCCPIRNSYFSNITYCETDRGLARPGMPIPDPCQTGCHFAYCGTEKYFRYDTSCWFWPNRIPIFTRKQCCPTSYWPETIKYINPAPDTCAHHNGSFYERGANVVEWTVKGYVHCKCVAPPLMQCFYL